MASNTEETWTCVLPPPVLGHVLSLACPYLLPPCTLRGLCKTLCQQVDSQAFFFNNYPPSALDPAQEPVLRPWGARQPLRLHPDSISPVSEGGRELKT